MFDHSAKTKRYEVKAYRIHQLVSVIWPFSQFGPSASTEKKIRSYVFSCYFEITQKNYFDFLQGIDLYSVLIFRSKQINLYPAEIIRKPWIF